MGGGQSRASNWIDNSIHASVNTIMNSTVKADVSLACTNSTIVRGAKNCDITIGDQICEAVGISNFTGSQKQSVQVAQDVANTLTAQAKSLTEGLNFSNSSSSSNHTQNLVDMAMNISQSFMTDCTRSVSAINEHKIENCEDSVLNYDSQMISAQVIGDCVSNQVGQTVAAQKLTNTVDTTAEATTKGIDLWWIVIIAAIIGFCVVFAAPIAYWMKKERREMTPDEIREERDTNRRMYAAAFIFFLLTLLAAFWWPGLAAWKLKISPHRATGVVQLKDLENLDIPVDLDTVACIHGQDVNRNLIINEFMWWDHNCLSTSGPAGCTQDKQVKSYSGCGLFATKSGCSDPLFLQEKQRYVEISDECGKLSGMEYAYCDARHLADKHILYEEGSYTGCKKCTEGNMWGLWVQEDATCDNVSQLDYARAGENCDPSDPHCKDSIEQLLQTSPNDCQDEAYQKAKKIFSQNLRICNRIEQLAKVNTFTNGGEKPRFGAQCPPSPFDYFSKCNAGSKKCSYTAAGSDPLEIASCHNDFDACCTVDEAGHRTCNDEEYLQDLELYEMINKKCKEKWQLSDELNPLAWQASLGAYAFLFALAIYLLVSNKVTRRRLGGAFRKSYGWFGGGGEDTLEEKSTASLRYMIMLFILFLVSSGIFVGGLFGTSSAYGIPMAMFKSNRIDRDWNTIGIVSIVIAAVFGTISLALFGVMMYKLFYSTRKGWLVDKATPDVFNAGKARF